MVWAKILSLLVIGSLLFPKTMAGWWGGRSRRSIYTCYPITCFWGSWSQWSACSHPCGIEGTQNRNRVKHNLCGFTGCKGPSEESKACDRLCYTGGTPQPGRCICQDGFWGNCCKYREYISLFSVPLERQISIPKQEEKNHVFELRVYNLISPIDDNILVEKGSYGTRIRITRLQAMIVTFSDIHRLNRD